MLRVPGNNAVHAGAGCTFDQDRVFIIAVVDAKRILAVNAKGVDQFKKGQELSDDLPGFRIDILFAFELLSGKEMQVSNLF